MLFLCENNFHAMWARLERAQSRTDLLAGAHSDLMPAEPVDGMDVLAVEAATRHAAEGVRRGEGPAFLEFRTYGFRARSMFDAELSREKSEVEDWRRRDPIARPKSTWRCALPKPAPGDGDHLPDEVRAGLEPDIAGEIRMPSFGADPEPARSSNG